MSLSRCWVNAFSGFRLYHILLLCKLFSSGKNLCNTHGTHTHIVHSRTSAYGEHHRNDWHIKAMIYNLNNAACCLLVCWKWTWKRWQNRAHTRSPAPFAARSIQFWLVYVFSEKYTHLLSHIQTHNKLFFMWILVRHRQLQQFECTYGFDSIRFGFRFMFSELFVYTSLHYYYTVLSMTILYDSHTHTVDRHALFDAIGSLVLFVSLCVVEFGVARIFDFFSLVFVRQASSMHKSQEYRINSYVIRNLCEIFLVTWANQCGWLWFLLFQDERLCVLCEVYYCLDNVTFP